MQFELTEDQQAIAGGIKEILKGVVTDESLKALDKAGEHLHARAWKALADAEMLGLALPESCGGADFGFLELCLLLEQVGRTVAPIPALETLVSAALPLAKFGSDVLQQRYLPGVVSGETILTAALADLGTRDALRPAATAEADAEGYRVSGSFTNVAFLEESARVLVAARVGEQVAVLLVDPQAEGATISAQRGTHGRKLSALSLDGVRVKADEQIGGLDDGEAILRFVVERTLVGMAAIEYGLARQALIMTAGFASERKQFGVPIGTFQAVKQRLGDAYVDVQCMEVSMLKAAFELDRSAKGESSPGDARAEEAVWIAKFWAADGGARVVAAAQHVHGGMGFDRDYPLFRYFLLSKHLEFTLGGAESSLERLGELLAS